MRGVAAPSRSSIIRQSIDSPAPRRVVMSGHISRDSDSIPLYRDAALISQLGPFGKSNYTLFFI